MSFCQSKVIVNDIGWKMARIPIQSVKDQGQNLTLLLRNN